MYIGHGTSGNRCKRVESDTSRKPICIMMLHKGVSNYSHPERSIAADKIGNQ
jgi:hypothetical protein